MRRAGRRVPVGERGDPLPPVVDAAPPTTLVPARLEAKYRIGRGVAPALREQLAARLTPHHHSVPPGVIASVALHHVTTTVYFDTDHRDLCRAAYALAQASCAEGAHAIEYSKLVMASIAVHGPL